jgi:predicted nucleic acid-binding protein
VFHIDLTPKIVARAKEIERRGIKPYDALHLASSEAGCVDIFLTTDRRLLAAAKNSDVSTKVENPLPWLTEVLYDQC